MPMLAKQVMAVDDEPDLLTVITAMLEVKGFQVHGFGDPVKALAHVNECKGCGIVITDVRMPIMNGFQLVRAIKNVRPDMRVVLMSSFEINKKECQQTMPSTQIDQFLAKPFSAVQLEVAIEKCSPTVRQSTP